MKKVEVFDVLVVYSEAVAISASSKTNTALSPFSHESDKSHYNNAYAYFLETCKKNNLKAAFTTSKDILKDGNFRSYWVYENNSWEKIKHKCTAPLIFDKFSSKNKFQRIRRENLFSKSAIRPFNNPDIYMLFLDKQRTFDILSKDAIPTVSIDNANKGGVSASLEKLKTILRDHPNKHDFSDEIILKDRFGAGGNNIYRIGKDKQMNEILKIILEEHRKSFVIQPFTKFSNGYSSKKFQGFVDVRIIHIGQEIIQAYVRTPKKNDFRCNEHQGGKLTYITMREIPKKVLQVSQRISKVLSEKNSFYALDFIVSDNGNVYLMEGNSKPGIDWNLSLKKNERFAKELIRKVVEEMGNRVTAFIDESYLESTKTFAVVDPSLQVAIL